MDELRTLLNTGIILLDGGTGTLLTAAGLPSGTPTESWSLTHPKTLIDIHRAYYDAGSQVVNTNTFGVNLLKYTEEKAEALVRASIKNVKKARETASKSDSPRFVSMDIGPMGKMMEPFGDLSFSDAVRAFSRLTEIAVSEGVDLISIETMFDREETRAALTGVRQVTDLPVFVTNSYHETGLLLTGAAPEEMVRLLEDLGADAVGANCSFGPAQLIPIVERMKDATRLPLILKPNAGLPEMKDGRPVYTLSPEDFANTVTKALDDRVRIIGGCCGTTPKTIRALSEKLINPSR